MTTRIGARNISAKRTTPFEWKGGIFALPERLDFERSPVAKDRAPTNGLQVRSKLLVALVTLFSFAACGDDGSEDSEPSGSDGPSGGGGSALEKRLAACPVVSNSKDPVASACLVGSYEGKTLDGKACSFEVETGGSFEFTSERLTLDYEKNSYTEFNFNHIMVSDSHQMSWMASDPTSPGDVWYILTFTARFGAAFPETDQKIQIDLSLKADAGDVDATCVVTL